MPTEKKVLAVAELEQKLSKCSIAIATDCQGFTMTNLTDLRRHLRQRGIEYRVVKNTLAHIAAGRINKPEFKEIIQGPTGLVLGYDDALEPAKALVEYLRVSRLPMTVRGAVLNGKVLSGEQVQVLATLPSREQLLSQLMGQMQAPIAALLGVLQGTVRGLATVLQRRAEQLQASV